MLKFLWIILFVLFFVADQLVIKQGNELFRLFTKAWIIPALWAYFHQAAMGCGWAGKKWIYPALFFSWAGDVLLLFAAQGEIFFVLGLSAFLLAHICYIGYFQVLRMREKIRYRFWLLFPVLIVYVFLMGLLASLPGHLLFPVRIYGVVISVMWVMSLHMFWLQISKASLLFIAGATLFVVSDALLAIDLFREKIPMAAHSIMMLYVAAQYFIISGALNYAKSRHAV